MVERPFLSMSEWLRHCLILDSLGCAEEGVLDQSQVTVIGVGIGKKMDPASIGSSI